MRSIRKAYGVRNRVACEDIEQPPEEKKTQSMHDLEASGFTHPEPQLASCENLPDPSTQSMEANAILETAVLTSPNPDQFSSNGTARSATDTSAPSTHRLGDTSPVMVGWEPPQEPWAHTADLEVVTEKS
eukprot:CAMPEP_0181339500 /NCGR_PEP_ID=MMETSP1101-20121128/29295_1 /TAXON_ID=46948 /ORGANISM="Rhodomonas abbreviata, Strain Caron Lab Isolate" /LENGTH=129 /DNA_ID=CAMNT_0023450485 /DNA_START=90 /DNA_END=479 /DNA_ORIENTATION=+